MKIQFLSDALAFLLLAVYIAGLIFTFFTHKYLFAFSSLENEIANKEKIYQWNIQEENIFMKLF
jgi:Ca2+/H+ antiporter